MTNRLTGYIHDRKQVFEAVKSQAKLIINKGEMTQEVSQRLLDEAFKLGRYIGRCQGEQYARELNKRVNDYDD